MAESSRQKRFTVSLDECDYAALKSLGDAQKPKLKLQYIINLAVRNLLDLHESKQLSFPLNQSPQ